MVQDKISSALGIEVIFYPSIDSTNTEAKRLLASKKAAPFLVIANEQTGGRGRQGKSFYSPKDTGIYMSLVLPLKAENTTLITAAAAVAVCQAIESLSDKSPEIKWVNDVYIGNKKVCGILCETVFDGSELSPVIIGIGLNVSTSSFPKELEIAGSLNADIERETLISEIAKRLIALCEKEADFLNYYRNHSCVIGKEITYIKNGVFVFASAIDIDESGALIVKNETGELTALSGGEISVLL